MTLFIENTIASNADLLIQDRKILRIFALPGDSRVSIPAGSDALLIKTPHVEPFQELGIVSLQEAREEIPVAEIIERGLDGYVIESQAIGEWTVNGVPLEEGFPVDDDGILFTRE